MGFARYFHRARWDRERRAEIESYIAIETEENIARGMAPAEARAAARRKLGNSILIREEIYRMNTIGFLDTLSRDVRYSLRSLRHNLAFSIVAVATIAIGIGANTAVFSVVNRVLLRPLDYPKSEQLVALRQLATGAAGLTSFADGLRLSPSMYFTYAEHNRTFQSLGVWTPGTANVTGVGEPQQVRALFVSDGVLEALGVPPVLGRWLNAQDQILQGSDSSPFLGRSTNVMLSYGYWQRRFGGERSVIGRNINLDSEPRRIIGVMPQSFRFVGTDADIIVPLAFDRSKLIMAGFGFQGIGRLKPGVSLAQADADLASLLPVWMDSWSNGPGTNPHIYETWKITPAVWSLKEELVGNVESVLWAVMGTIGLVMLIACANVANLLLVRTEARQQELAVRTALGAGSRQIVRSLLVESLMLSLAGGAIGVLLAGAGLRLLLAIGPANLPRLNEISLDAWAIGFTLALSVLSGLLFGLIPALKYSGSRISAALHSAGRTASVSRERHRARNLLLVAQVAMALVLLVSAGLMIRTFQALRTVDPGFTGPAQLQVMRISIPDLLIKDADRVTRTQNDILDKLAAVPGVTSVGFGSEMPLEGFAPDWDEIFVEGRKYRPNEIQPIRMYQYVSPGFFHAAGTRILAGRDLTWTEVYDHRPVVLISANLAREIWGTPEAALGGHLSESPGPRWSEVVGVVQDVFDSGLDQKAPEIVYWPPLVEGFFGPGPRTRAIRDVTYVVRSERTGSESFLNDTRKAVWSVNPELPVASVRSMREVYDQSLARTSFTLVMLAIAGSMALVLGAIGIYGVISYAVSQRRREIGIRLALGAQPAELKKMFVRHGLKLTGIGLAIGLIAAIALMRLMKSLLFGISPLDPLTYIAVPIVLAVAAFLASYLPARRAAAVDPVEALKAE
ncbi:MAG TPA: ABC transporter permease [Bryobacteraceae bacterium]|nr:ABC transporter permease [Bryobacteraceae bacterium]